MKTTILEGAVGHLNLLQWMDLFRNQLVFVTPLVIPPPIWFQSGWIHVYKRSTFQQRIMLKNFSTFATINHFLYGIMIFFIEIQWIFQCSEFLYPIDPTSRQNIKKYLISLCHWVQSIDFKRCKSVFQEKALELTSY